MFTHAVVEKVSAKAGDMDSISGIKDGFSWGGHFNRYDHGSTHPFPEWANLSQKRTLENHGVIVWDEATRHVVWLRGSQPLDILEQTHTTKEWETEGITIGEWVIQFSIELPKRGRKPKNSPPSDADKDTDSSSEWVYIDQISLSADQVKLLAGLIEAHEEVLKIMRDEDIKRKNDAIMQLLNSVLEFSTKQGIDEPPARQPDLADIEREKLKRAVEKMSKSLAIPAAVPDVYDLVAACENEWRKAVKNKIDADLGLDSPPQEN